MTDSNDSQCQDTLPDYVDIEKWAEQGYYWQGNLKITKLDRLNEIVTCKENSSVPLSFSITRSSGVYWFKFDIETSVEAECQRCLNLMKVPLVKKVNLAILEDEQQAGLLDEDDDWVLVQDVAKCIGKEIRLPVASVIEDELLLEVPMSPKHELHDKECVPVDIIDGNEIDNQNKKENPFSVLAELKGQL